MEVRSNMFGSSKCNKLSYPPPPPPPPPLPSPSPLLLAMLPRSRLQMWFIRICSCVLLWTCLVQLMAIGDLWRPMLPTRFALAPFSNGLAKIPHFSFHPPPPQLPTPATPPPPLLPLRMYKSNGYLKVSCNGGLNQMRAAICDMVAVARLLNLTLVVPELDKKSFWADPSTFGDIFDVRHFIDSLRDEIHIIKRLPKKFNRKTGGLLVMPPVSWSSEKYYLQQVLPLFSKYKVIHFNKTDTRLANNGLSSELQKLRCRVNFQALKFTAQIEALGNKLVSILQEQGSFMTLHLRYEMDMLAFSGCTHGCSEDESQELKRMRYAYPWWREKEIVSEERRLQGLCPLTPEETALVLQALGFGRDTRIYIASGEIYGSEWRLSALRAAFPRIVKKEMLLDPTDLQEFHNHSSQMAALDYMVSISSDIFIPTYDGNMAKLVEGHRRYLGFRKTILLNRRKLVQLIDLHLNNTISWDEFAGAVRQAHQNRMGRPVNRSVITDKPKEEDYFYANPRECVCETTECYGGSNASAV
ncbi:hypothetical protein AAC387_Pa01g0012 [Persea americana]